MSAKKKIFIASMIATLGVGAFGVSSVFAAQHGSTNYMSGLVNAIAQKFHLAPSDVQAVVDAQRQQQTDQMKQQVATRFASSLAQAVKDGKLTQAQADLITAKQAEIQTFEATLQGKTPADRAAATKTEADTLKAWATTNNIPQQYVNFGRGMGFEMGGMMNRNPKAMLDQAVKDGKITQAQEDLIVAKQAEVKTFTDSLNGKSNTDRQAAMKTETDALTAWATTNNIPSQYILPFGGGMMRGGGIGHGMPGGMRGGRGLEQKGS